MKTHKAIWLLNLVDWGWLQLLDELEVDVIIIGLNKRGWFNCGAYPEFIPYIITKKGEEYNYYHYGHYKYDLIKNYYFGYPEEVVRYVSSADQLTISRSAIERALEFQQDVNRQGS